MSAARRHASLEECVFSFGVCGVVGFAKVSPRGIKQATRLSVHVYNMCVFRRTPLTWLARTTRGCEARSTWLLKGMAPGREEKRREER